MPDNFEPAAQMTPDRDAQFVARLGETEEWIAAIPADVAPCSCADLVPCHVTANVVLRAIGVEWDFPPVLAQKRLISFEARTRRDLGFDHFLFNVDPTMQPNGYFTELILHSRRGEAKYHETANECR